MVIGMCVVETRDCYNMYNRGPEIGGIQSEICVFLYLSFTESDSRVGFIPEIPIHCDLMYEPGSN